MQTVKRTRRSASSSSDPVSSTRHRGEPVSQQGHVPVLLHEVLDVLALKPDDVVVDATLGGAGHTQEIAARLSEAGVVVGIDADAQAVARARVALESVAPRVTLVQANFRTMQAVLRDAGIPAVTKVLFDLGWSGYQLADKRGFSFLADEPLIMTYADEPEKGAVTADMIVNSWAEESIAQILEGWGDERYSRRIARAIVEARRRSPVKTAKELSDIVRRAVPRSYAFGKIHPATRTFQALRIAVNDEFGAIREGLSGAWRMLAPGGRLAVISFHSLEDREVKHLMRSWETSGEGKHVTRSPLTPSTDEVKRNPRARSAKLRCIEKL